jgi:hypothetical protein
VSDDTLRTHPTAKRPENGFIAWQATIGYISEEHSPDAMLSITAYPIEESDIRWRAAASWGQFQEEVADHSSIAHVLRELWREVDRHHMLFKSMESASRRPINYADDQWLDTDTNDMLNRLLHASTRAFRGDWRLMLVYQPVANPNARVQARLIARGDSINAGGRGGSLREACQTLYRNAASYFSSAT